MAGAQASCRPGFDLVHWATVAWGAFGSSDSESRRSESGHAAPSTMAANVPTSDTRRVALGGRPAQAPTAALGPPLVLAVRYLYTFFLESSFINHSMQRRPVLARRPLQGP